MIKSKVRNIAAGLCLICVICSCSHDTKKRHQSKEPLSEFRADSLTLKKNCDTKKLRGQVLYMPVYSNVPYHKNGKRFDMSAFVAIHNTDLTHKITLTRVLFFDNDGKMVSNCLKQKTVINSLGAADFFIPEQDKSGTGANFLVEWVSDIPVTEPLIETVMLGLSRGQSISFASHGRVIREMK